MARMTKSFLATLVLAIFLLLIVDSFTNSIYASERLELQPRDLHTPENLWRLIELENSPPHLLVTPPIVLTFDEPSIEKMLSPDCQIFDRSNSTEARLKKKLSLLRNRQQIESALKFADQSEIFEPETPGASLHAMPALLLQLDWHGGQTVIRNTIARWQQHSAQIAEQLTLALPIPASIDPWFDGIHALADWAEMTGRSKTLDLIATSDQELLPLPQTGGILIGSLKVARHHRIEQSNTIVFQVPAGEAPLKGLSQRQVELIRQSISAQCDQYWQYYEDCDYWRVQFAAKPELTSANQITAITAAELDRGSSDTSSFWSTWSHRSNQLDLEWVQDAHSAWMAPLTKLNRSIEQLKGWIEQVEFRLIETVE